METNYVIIGIYRDRVREEYEKLRAEPSPSLNDILTMQKLVGKLEVLAWILD